MRNILKYYTFYYFLTMNACSSNMKENDYFKYISKSENGLKKVEKALDFNYELQFCPTDYLLLIDKHKEELTTSNLKERRKQYDQGFYFFFKIISEKSNTNCLIENLQSKDDKNKKFDYFNYKIKDEIKLVQNSDTINCNIFFFENNNNLSPECKFVLGFKPPNKKNDFDIIFKGILLNKMPLKFNYNYKKILNCPKANINI